MNLINPFDLINEGESNGTKSITNSWDDQLSPASDALNKSAKSPAILRRILSSEISSCEESDVKEKDSILKNILENSMVSSHERLDQGLKYIL